MSMPARRNSSASSGMSNRLELNPPKSHPLMAPAMSLATALNVGQFFTSSSVMPCTAVACSGMCISGLMRMVLLSSVPLGDIFRYDISTMRSATMLVPVVSRSKNTMGFFRFSFMFVLWCLSVYGNVFGLDVLVQKGGGCRTEFFGRFGCQIPATAVGRAPIALFGVAV